MTASPVTGYTSSFQFNLVNYTSNEQLVQKYEQQNWAKLDAVLTNLFALINISAWTIKTPYIVGTRVADGISGSIYICVVPHTSGTSFSQDRQYNPSYWVLVTAPTTIDLISSVIKNNAPTTEPGAGGLWLNGGMVSVS